MSFRRTLKVVALLAMLLFCVIVGRSMFWMPAIASHEGDGDFQDHSRRVCLVALPGYSVTMPEFDLGHQQHAEYHLKGLTHIGRDCGVYLAIRDHDERWWGDTSDLGGNLNFELVDSHGRVVVNVAGPLGNFTWWGFGNLHALYQLHKSSFEPNSAETYRLRLTYEPDARLAGYKGFVYVRSGGVK